MMLASRHICRCFVPTVDYIYVVPTYCECTVFLPRSRRIPRHNGKRDLDSANARTFGGIGNTRHPPRKRFQPASLQRRQNQCEKQLYAYVYICVRLCVHVRVCAFPRVNACMRVCKRALGVRACECEYSHVGTAKSFGISRAMCYNCSPCCTNCCQLPVSRLVYRLARYVFLRPSASY